MSFAQLLRSADARLRLDLVRPAAPRLDAPQAPPPRLPPPLAASAVANAIRAEFARRDASARGVWRADRAPARLGTLAPDMVPMAQRALALAQGGTGRAAAGASPAERALQLARLEGVVRVGYVDGRIGQSEDAEDVAEVATLLARVPWDELGKRMAPPPLFPSLAESMPDAEPDALVDETLLTVSAARAPRVDEEELRALVARLVIARAEWGADEAAARVRSVGVLLARHGIVWRAPVAPIVAHDAFPAVEAWLLERLADARGEPALVEPDARAPRSTLPKWVKKRFAPRAPGTHPAGKAEKKKGTTHKRAPPQRQPPAAHEPRRRASDAPQGPTGEAPKRGGFSRPDWRRGSAWRRQRGL